MDFRIKLQAEELQFDVKDYDGIMAEIQKSDFCITIIYETDDRCYSDTWRVRCLNRRI